MPASEFDLIAAINERLPAPDERVRVPSGDDAAVVEGDPPSVVSVDAIVDRVHFALEAFGAEAVGRKALAAGLSDLAAMGADPGEAYVVVGAPAEMPDEQLLEMADGLAGVATRDDVSIAGGDLVSSPVLVVSVTAIGYEPDAASLVGRGGASPGDAVAVTGELGAPQRPCRCSASGRETRTRPRARSHRSSASPCSLASSIHARVCARVAPWQPRARAR